VIWLPFTKLKRMELRINKVDFTRLIDALMIAAESESNANRKRYYNLTRKKLNRQQIYELRKTNNKRKNS
jgi:hypothetical protein